MLVSSIASASDVSPGLGEFPPHTIKNNVVTYHVSCPQHMTGNDCAIDLINRLQTVENYYLSEIQKRMKRDGESAATLSAMKAENKAWNKLIDKASYATSEEWQGGATDLMPIAMGTSREIELMGFRIHDQWSSWLTYMDSTPAILQEPTFVNHLAF